MWSSFGEFAIWLVFTLLLKPVLGQMRDDENPLEFNLWREYRHARGATDEKTLYARDRHCLPPEPLVALQSHSHKEATWSFMFSRYTFDGGEELDSWLKHQEYHPETEQEKHTDEPIDRFIPIIFPFFFIFFLAFSVLIIPLLGALGFQIFEVIWWVITHQEIKRGGRYMLIVNEKMSRKRQKILMPEAMKKPPKSRFILPPFFRIHSDEDIPAQLEESDTDKDWRANAVPSDEERDDKFSDEGASLSGLESTVSIPKPPPAPKIVEADADANAAAATAAGAGTATGAPVAPAAGKQPAPVPAAVPAVAPAVVPAAKSKPRKSST